MMRGKPAGGYTIVEVMVFLAVSGVMFLMAALFINGKQANTEFTQGMNNFNATLLDYMNDVGDGYFPSNSNFSCNAPAAGAISFSSSATPLGQNSKCIFLGKVIQFRPSGVATDYYVYSVAARHYNANTTDEVSTLDQAWPAAITNPVNLTEKGVVPSGIIITKLVYQKNSGVAVDQGAVAFITNFGTYVTATGAIESGARNVSLVATNTPDAADQPTVITSIKNLHEIDRVTSGGKFVICTDDGHGRFGAITIGSNSGQLTTSVKFIKDALC